MNIFLFFLLCTYSSFAFCSIEESVASFMLSLENSKEKISEGDYMGIGQLTALEDYIASIAQKLEAITQDDCDEQGLVSVVHVEKPTAEPNWVIFARQTSNDISIFKQDGQYVVKIDKEKIYVLREGDHNLWFCEKGILHGYNSQGSPFLVDEFGKPCYLSSLSVFCQTILSKS